MLNLLQSLPKAKNITFTTYMSDNSTYDYLKSVNEINYYNEKNINPHINKVYFIPLEPATIGFHTSKVHTCKETFINHIRGIFSNKGGKFVELPFMVIMCDKYASQAIDFIRKFENEILKINNNSVFEGFENYDNRGVIKITPARRWARTPQVYYILTTLFRLAHLYDENQSVKENLIRIYEQGYGNDFFEMIDFETIKQFRKSFELYKKIFELGFENIFKSSKYFESAWCIGKFSDNFDSMANMGPVSLGQYKFDSKLNIRQNDLQVYRDKYFTGLTEEIKEFFLGTDKNKPATKAA